jgi:CRP/FNR family transcriptional regulator, cyclic AMP receptor protein
VARASKKTEYLATVPLFSALSPAELTEVAQATDEVDATAGQTLVDEGRVGREFFLILSGESVVERDGQEVARLGPGQWFGELSLLDHQPRSASVRAVTDMKLLVLGEAVFAGVLENVPTLAAKLLRNLAHRLRDADAAAD